MKLHVYVKKEGKNIVLCNTALVGIVLCTLRTGVNIPLPAHRGVNSHYTARNNEQFNNILSNT